MLALRYQIIPMNSRTLRRHILLSINLCIILNHDDEDKYDDRRYKNPCEDLMNDNKKIL